MSYWENPEKLWSFGGDCALHCPQEAAEVGRRGAAGELYCSRLPAVDQRVMERQQLLVPSLLGVSIGNMHSDGRFPDSFFFARISSHSKQQGKAELT